MHVLNSGDGFLAFQTLDGFAKKVVLHDNNPVAYSTKFTTNPMVENSKTTYEYPDRMNQ